MRHFLLALLLSGNAWGFRIYILDTSAVDLSRLMVDTEVVYDLASKEMKLLFGELKVSCGEMVEEGEHRNLGLLGGQTAIIDGAVIVICRQRKRSS